MKDCPACNQNSVCCALCNDTRQVSEKLLEEWLAGPFNSRYNVSRNIALRKKYEKTSEERWPEAWPRYGKVE